MFTTATPFAQELTIAAPQRQQEFPERMDAARKTVPRRQRVKAADFPERVVKAAHGFAPSVPRRPRRNVRRAYPAARHTAITIAPPAKPLTVVPKADSEFGKA